MHTLRRLAIVGLAISSAALAACKKKDEKPAPAPSPTPPPPTTGSAPAPAPPADPAPITAGLSTPESILHDVAADRYLVANINGSPVDGDDNGYISAIAIDGTVTSAKWIDGAAADVTLNAPKGMAISGGVLWVADITVVRKFDPTSGKPLGEVPIPGASFLNDVAPAADGGIVVSDTGVNGKFEPVGADAVYRIGKDGAISTVIKDKTLGGPNGVWVAADGAVWVVTFMSGELYKVEAGGAKQASLKLPKGQLDGVIGLDGGDLLVSSWEGGAVYRGTPGGEWRAVVENVTAPADIGWDGKRNRVLIPGFTDSTARFVTLK